MGADAFHIASIIGTRPEAIKMAPVLRELARRPGIRQTVVLTGQHQGLAIDESAVPGCNIQCLAFDPRHQTAGEIREAIQYALHTPLRRDRPAMVLVQGDTSSALAGALAAADCGIPVGHVEAGLRSHDLQQPWPEEGNRVAIDALADLLFAPTDLAAHNLADEGVKGRVAVTGNSGIDALFQARRPMAVVREPGSRKLILATCHRRINRGEALQRVAMALKRIARELPVDIVFPLHPNPHVRTAIEALLTDEPHIRLIEPVGYEEMVALIDASWIILTDSGGLQEEGPALGKPVLVLRNVTERPEAGASLELVGTDPDRIAAAVTRLLTDPAHYTRMATPSTAFGKGHASERIVDLIEAYFRDRQTTATRNSP